MFPYTCSQTKELHREMVETFECMDFHYTQVNQFKTHMHRVTHIQKACKCTHTDTHTQTHMQTHTHIDTHTRHNTHLVCMVMDE